MVNAQAAGARWLTLPVMSAGINRAGRMVNTSAGQVLNVAVGVRGCGQDFRLYEDPEIIETMGDVTQALRAGKRSVERQPPPKRALADSARCSRISDREDSSDDEWPYR